MELDPVELDPAKTTFMVYTIRVTLHRSRLYYKLLVSTGFSPFNQKSKYRNHRSHQSRHENKKSENPEIRFGFRRAPQPARVRVVTREVGIQLIHIVFLSHRDSLSDSRLRIPNCFSYYFIICEREL